MEMQLQTKDTLATLHLDPRTKLYLLIVGNVALFLAPSLLYAVCTQTVRERFFGMVKN